MATTGNGSPGFLDSEGQPIERTYDDSTREADELQIGVDLEWNETTVESLLRQVLPPTEERLKLLRRLARGGMGAIEVVIDSALRRRVAKKIMHERLRDNRRAVGWFIREAQITGQLDHPHIVPVHEIGVDGDARLYFTMKLVEGQTYGAYVRDLPEGPLEPSRLFDLLTILTKVCDALAFAHSRHVVHCDIKPQNVMVGSFGEVYLMDWGLARVRGELSLQPGATVGADVLAEISDCEVLGTPAYMSPEQAEQGPIDQRTDVFTLGALLYYAFTRTPPYTARTVIGAMVMAKRCEIDPLRQAAPGAEVPAELERIVMKAMARDPADRYETVTAFREDVTRFMRGGGEFPRRRWNTGDLIVTEGETGDAAYILVSGRTEVFKMVEGAREPIREMGPGSVFGEMAILNAEPRSASVVALEPCVTLVVTRDVFERELDAMKPWMGAFFRTLSRRFREREEDVYRDPTLSGRWRNS